MIHKNRALFLDRDGVINFDYGYVFQEKNFIVIDGVFDSLRSALACNYKLIIVTNQSGIARGYYSVSDYLLLENYIRSIFLDENIYFTGIYYCPHHPDGVVPEFKLDCDCRKPRPGMLLSAAEDHGIDLARSVMVGDKESDVAAAVGAGVKRTYLLNSQFALADIDWC